MKRFDIHIYGGIFSDRCFIGFILSKSTQLIKLIVNLVFLLCDSLRVLTSRERVGFFVMLILD